MGRICFIGFVMLSSLSPSSSSGMDDSVKEVGLSTFKTDVLEASKKALVLVSFWALGSTACQQLTPILEKIARASKGTIKLAKIDLDRNLPIAQQMGVQSAPSVFAFSQGRPVDAFAGAIPEAQVKAWIDDLLKTVGAKPSEEKAGLETALRQAADFLAAKDTATARAIYADILDMEPTHAQAYAGLIRCFLDENDLDSAREMLAAASDEITKDKALDSVRTALDLAEQAGQSGRQIAEIEARLAQNPADPQTRFDLALACYGVGKREEAVDHLLEIVRHARSWNEDAARKQLVKFFEAFGATDPLTLSARKRLSSLLFS